MEACAVCDGTGQLLGDVCPLCEAGDLQQRPRACKDEDASIAKGKSFNACAPALSQSGLCLVLDIDGTLLSESVQSDCTIAEMREWMRPHLPAFLHFAFESFASVAIWTAASSEWLNMFLQAVDPGGHRTWAFAWTGSRCNLSRDRGGLGNSDSLYPVYSKEKRLKKVWGNKLLRALGYSRSSTLIVDNTPEVCRFNYGNAIYIKTFEDDGSDNWLLVLTSYLKTLIAKHHAGISMRCVEKRGWYVATRAEES
eukprot:TRINITY_DN42343_c0_g1_i1.p1 TRINITY_DN42343_c0_g1~~TRINITY_DN42343_c0_g1_i1.p1  ORF type:complete len:253 (+),score=22.08 TRINITY_DN42343_c0_g1_i1:49-807(+)